jgi:hypothetical protein
MKRTFTFIVAVKIVLSRYIENRSVVDGRQRNLQSEGLHSNGLLQADLHILQEP